LPPFVSSFSPRCFIINTNPPFISGYRLRTKIGEGLKKRGTALNTAIRRYNDLAERERPPLPRLQWDDVASAEFLGELEFLRLRRTNVCDQPWSIPGVRTAMALHQKMERAREEIIRVAVEARRLEDWIGSRALHRHLTVNTLKTEGSSLANVVQRHCAYLNAIDGVVLGDLETLKRSPRFGEGTVFLTPPTSYPFPDPTGDGTFPGNETKVDVSQAEEAVEVVGSSGPNDEALGDIDRLDLALRVL
jgi:hypothetical protein